MGKVRNVFQINFKIIKILFIRRTLIHYYYQWKSLPAVIQLEKVKEEKKRKWREKVWEILPNYDPIFDVIYN